MRYKLKERRGNGKACRGSNRKTEVERCNTGTCRPLLSMSGWSVVQTANGLVLDLAKGKEGGKLIVYTMHGGDNQLWRMEEGRLVNKLGFVADIWFASMEKG